ncbi:stemmadenine O-acetyltransferase-like [Tripterygium wilfordii]|uniref:stemmadenine O-acetyltransferase-like n=1 Tax=Tripterygium wilfordii TaxID=458696 RepID=UPI0018F800F5|nr:stemmadenine O-acetyltransferase-like [Tripterygium wilfordii]
MPKEILLDEVTPGAHSCMVKINVFACGGIAIGVVAQHKFFDGSNLFIFVKTWAGMTAGGGRAHTYQSPDFSASIIFPQNNGFPQDLTSASLSSVFVRKGKPATSRFVFDGHIISKLKTQATNYGIQNPTRKVKSGAPKSVVITNAVNLRPRASPPFTSASVGNFVLLVSMITKVEETDLGSFVHQTREALSRIDGDLVKSLQGDQGLGNLCGYMKRFRELNSKAKSDGAESISFNSGCNMGQYDVDYGWGKPLWVPFLGMVRSYPIFFIQLMDTRRGKGIEAWLMLDEPVISMLEHDKLLLSTASLDPSPLQIGSLKSSL